MTDDQHGAPGQPIEPAPAPIEPPAAPDAPAPPAPPAPESPPASTPDVPPVASTEPSTEPPAAWAPDATAPAAPPPAAPPPADPGVPPPLVPWDVPAGGFDGPRPDDAVLGRRIQVLSAIGRSMDIFVWRPLLFLGISLVAAVLSASTSLVYAGQTVPNAGLTLLVTIVVGLVGLWTSLATMIAADDIRAGRPAAFGDVAGRALGRLIPAVLSAIAVGLIIFGIAVVGVIVIGVLATAAPILGAIAGIAFFVVFAAVVLRWTLGMPAIALENRGPISALNRSRAILKGNVWRLFLVWLIYGLLSFPLSIAISSLALTGTDTILAFALSMLLGLVLAPISGILFATIFGDLTGRPDTRTAVEDRAGRWIIAIGVLVLGIAGFAIAAPKLGGAFGRLQLQSVPTADRGRILAGTSFSRANPCRPGNVGTTFSSTDTIYIGGYFTQAVPAGQTGEVALYQDGALLTKQPFTVATQDTVCYYETSPLIGAPPGTYRLVVTYQGNTIAEGEFTVR